MPSGRDMGGLENMPNSHKNADRKLIITDGVFYGWRHYALLMNSALGRRTRRHDFG